MLTWIGQQECFNVSELQTEMEQGELAVLMEDECHLLWGDSCGYVWGRRGEPIEVEMTNEKARQTYYGALNLQSGSFHLKPFAGGNSDHTVDDLNWLRTLYPDKKLLIIWDGASYHRSETIRDDLSELNQGLEAEPWPITCMRLAPNAPEQNPVEDLWLKGKNQLRKRFYQNKTFAQVKQCFVDFFSDKTFLSAKSLLGLL